MFAPSRLSSCILFAAVVASLAGCGANGGESGPANNSAHNHPGLIAIDKPYAGAYPIEVACTTGMVADLVKNVGGQRVRVAQIMADRVDPHTYKASPGDVAQLSSADMIFYSGLHLEGKMTDIFVRLARKKPTFAVTECIAEDKVLETAEGAYDPHLWFDVSLWREAAGVVRDALAAFDPPHAAEYRAAADAYQRQLDELHDYARRELATVQPADRRVLVTAHDAFRYFGRAYGVEVRGIQGISTESEAGVKEINELVKFLVERRIKAVFIETSVNDKNIASLREGCAAQGHAVVIGGELYSDAMGAAGTPEGTYVGMVRHNVDTIVRALR